MKKYTGVDTLEILEGAKEYNSWIVSKIRPWVMEPVLEVGAGTGNITSFFLTHLPFVITDKDEHLLDTLRKKFTHVSDAIRISLLDIEKKPKNHLSYFKSVIAVNVLEHIEDDTKALRHIHQLLAKEGRVILLVPAKKFAYTKLDKHIGHFRRYEKKQLQQKLTDAGFSLEHIAYFNIVGLLSWMIRDRVDRNNNRLSPNHIRIFDSIVPFLRIIESYIPPPMGISLIAVGKKKE